MAVAVRDPNLDRLRLYALKKRRAQQQEAPSDVLTWAERYRRIDSQPFSLARFEPLRAIYQDAHPHICIIKPAQRGVSEFAVNYTTFALDRGAAVWTDSQKDGLNVGYIFPTREALGDFSKERITGLVQESSHLAQLFSGDDDFNAITFKQVGRSYLYLRGGWSESSLLSFAADVLVLDEFDRMDPKTVALAQRRMNASIVHRELDISTPTIPGQGIHGQYLRSDRQVYEQRHACGEWVSFDFFRDVRVDGAAYAEWRQWSPERIGVGHVALVCPVCQETLTTAERCAAGRWRAEAPEVTGLRGYWVPWWPFPVCDLTRLAITAISQDPSQIEELSRSDLGLPYETGGSRITREQLAALSHELPNGLLPDMPWRDTTLGVDVGSRFHYRVSSTGTDGHRYVRAMGSVESWTDLDVLMARYSVRLAVVDAFPEQHAARAFVDRHPGRAVTATYPTSNALKGVLFSPEHQKAVADGRVSINRTMAMDAVSTAVATASERWPAEIHNDPEVVEHMTAPVRVAVLDAHGQPRADWVHTKPDHLYHACLVAGAMVKTEHGDVPIERVRAGMRVWTRSGLRVVRAAGMTAQDAEVNTYRFSNGASLTGTPNHPIHTESRGYIPLHATVYDDIISVWQESKRLSIAASFSAVTQTVRAVLTGCTSPLAERIVRPVSSDSTRRSGRTSTGQSLTDTSSIIRMRTPSTTLLRTSSVSRRASIAHSTRRWSGQLVPTLTRSGRSRMHGDEPSKVENGTVSMLTRRSGLSSLAGTCAFTVAGRSQPCRRSARVLAVPVRMPATVQRVERVAWMMLIASAWSAARRSVSTAIERPQRARLRAVVDSRVRPSGHVAAGRADVFNLSVEGDEEYYANGLLVHNCVYDTVARALLPKAVLGGIGLGAARDSRVRT